MAGDGGGRSGGMVALPDRAGEDRPEASGLAQPPASLGVRVALAIEDERARWFYWVPVFIGVGIAVYFALPVEPPLWLALLAPVVALAARIALGHATLVTLATGAVTLASVGFALVTVRTAVVAAPVLEARLDRVDVEGFVERVEPRTGRGERITLRVTRLGALAPDATPQRVRIRTPSRVEGLGPGDALSVRASLSPPAAPALPGGYDFGRYAYFQGIGGVGYATEAPRRVVLSATPPLSLRIWSSVERLRQSITRRIEAALPGETGAIAAALLSGERGAISDATNDAYRNSGLFHILSISGLHMAIMGGAVFWFVRLLLALVPAVALVYPIKKWAAIAAGLASLAYLAISGGSFATVRSFIMIAVMFLAILLDRPALAMRNVAVSALLILVLYPESLLDAGFQMSFAAVVALVAAYEVVRDRLAAGPGRGDIGPVLRVGLFFGGIVMTTLVASVAVAPFAAYHFHKSQQYAVVANLLAVPITNFIVMPAALATLIVMPLGLEAGPLYVMGAGIDAMSVVARWVGAFPGAVVHLPAMSTASFAAMLAGGLWLTLWHAHWRLLGLAGAGAGIVLAVVAKPPAPDVLVGRGGNLVAVRGGDGLLAFVGHSGRAEFEIERWLEHDGDARASEGGKVLPAYATVAAAPHAPSAGPSWGSGDATEGTGRVANDVPLTGGGRGHGSAGGPSATARVIACDNAGCLARIKGTLVAVPRHAAALAEDCRAADLLVLAVPRPTGCAGPAQVIDPGTVRRGGTSAIYLDGSRQIRIETTAAARGVRPWSPSYRDVRDWKRAGGARRPAAGEQARATPTTFAAGAEGEQHADEPGATIQPDVSGDHGRETSVIGARRRRSGDDPSGVSRLRSFAAPNLAGTFEPPRPEDEDDGPAP
ncbi:MAG: ComEC family competence protein [Hyphomicrobiaceae bacterium]|nr:ComEC family competence protein [Hyphomicrobiaceae bacterium]